MSKEIAIAMKVKRLKIGSHFLVTTESDRQKALRVAKSLKDAGVIGFDVVTKSDENGQFKIAAI